MPEIVARVLSDVSYEENDRRAEFARARDVFRVERGASVRSRGARGRRADGRGGEGVAHDEWLTDRI